MKIVHWVVLLVKLVTARTVCACLFTNRTRERQSSLRLPSDGLHRHLQSSSSKYITDRELVPVCPLGPTVTSLANTHSVYAQLKREIAALVDDADELTRSNIFGAALRTAFHDAGEIDIRTDDLLGPDGCLSNSDSNAGLIERTTVPFTVFEPLWKKLCDRITRADFVALLGKLCVERAEPTRTLRIPFFYGRRDNDDCDAGAGRLPEHQPGLSELFRVFIDQMGLKMSEVVTLLGAHSLGHVHPEFTGFGTTLTAEELKKRPADNAWDVTPSVFDNEYFRGMLQQTWENKIHVDNAPINTWNVVYGDDAKESPKDVPKKSPLRTLSELNTEGELLSSSSANSPDKDKAKEQEKERLIMLNSDLVLSYPIHTDVNPANGAHTGVQGETCHIPTDYAALAHAQTNADAEPVCVSSKYGTVSGAILSSTLAQVRSYAEDSALFLRDFAAAYVKLTTVGYSLPAGDNSSGNNENNNKGKLGELFTADVGSYWDE